MRILNKFKQLLLKVFDPEGLSFLKSKKVTGNMVLIFLLLVFSPAVYKTARISGDWNTKYIDENRAPVEKPVFGLNSVFPYFEQYEKYFNDQFVFRGFLISSFNRLRFNLFGASPVNSVYTGKAGWLFLAEENGINLDPFYFAFDPFEREVLEQFRNRIIQRREWAESLGCSYLFVVVPNKQTVYPEMMPQGLDRVPEKSMMDQVSVFLRSETGETFVDLREPLLRRKEKHRVYQRTDTHWNQLGAFAAYREILRSLAAVSGKKIVPETISRFLIKTKAGDGGDLARILTMQRDNFKDRITILERKGGVEGQSVGHITSIPYKEMTIEKGINESGPFSPLLFIHDSFGEYLRGFFIPHFKELYFSNKRELKFFEDLIRERGITYIVEEIAERHFLQIQRCDHPGL